MNETNLRDGNFSTGAGTKSDWTTVAEQLA
jgi:hypothetical protein